MIYQHKCLPPYMLKLLLLCRKDDQDNNYNTKMSQVLKRIQGHIRMEYLFLRMDRNNQQCKRCMLLYIHLLLLHMLLMLLLY